MKVEGSRGEEVESNGVRQSEVMLSLGQDRARGRRIRSFGEREEDGLDGLRGERGGIEQ